MSPPALDIVNGSWRPGGPGLYAGIALKLVGAKPLLVGPIGYMTLATVAVEREAGLARLGYSTTSPGAVFEIRYRGDERSVEPLHQPPALDTVEVLKAVRRLYWDAVILSPLLGEEAGWLLPLLWSSARLVVVDVQGYSRAGLVDVVGGRGVHQLLHASRGEDVWGEEPWGIAVVTDGMGPIRVYTSWGEEVVVDPVGPRLSDPTGAGDAFTGLLAVMLLRGYSLGDAVERASSMVHIALSKARGYMGAGNDVLP